MKNSLMKTACFLFFGLSAQATTITCHFPKTSKLFWQYSRYQRVEGKYVDQTDSYQLEVEYTDVNHVKMKVKVLNAEGKVLGPAITRFRVTAIDHGDLISIAYAPYATLGTYGNDLHGVIRLQTTPAQGTFSSYGSGAKISETATCTVMR